MNIVMLNKTSEFPMHFIILFWNLSTFKAYVVQENSGNDHIQSYLEHLFGMCFVLNIFVIP